MAKVILPRNQHFGPSAPPPVHPANETGDRSERILLLEDEEQTNLVLKEYLQSFGYRVVAVANGVDGLKEVIKSDFELVICDMMMPKLPGNMFYLAVQKTRPHLCNRFVFITGHQGTPDVEAFIRKTQAAVLVKPFRLQQLEITLRGVLTLVAKKAEEQPDLKIIPNRRYVEGPQTRVIGKADSSASASHEHPPQPDAKPLPPIVAKRENVPSIVVKALKIVGFMRKHDKVVPPPINTSKENEQPRPLFSQTIRVTQRIPHLAVTPIERPVFQPTPADESAKPEGVSVSTHFDRPDLPQARITPLFLAPLPKQESPSQTENSTLRVKDVAVASKERAPRLTRKVSSPAPTLVVPEVPTAKVTRTNFKTTRTIKLTQPTKNVSAPVPAPAIPKVTQSIPKVTRAIPKVTQPIPKVTRAIPKVTQSIPKVTRAIPKVTQSIPKVTRAIPKVTQPIPKVTRAIPKVTQPIPKVTRAIPKVTQPIPKVTRAIPKVTQPIPKVTRAIPKVTQSIPKAEETVPKVTRGIPRPGPVEPKVTRTMPKTTIRVQRTVLKLAEPVSQPKVTARVSRKISQTAPVVTRRVNDPKKF